MGSLAQSSNLQNNTKSTQIKNKIPEYARDFKKEWRNYKRD